MEAEDELQQIWGNKTKKLQVRTVTNVARHPINKLRQNRWSDVQAESVHYNNDPLTDYTLERRNSMGLIPERPSNPQGRDSYFSEEDLPQNFCLS
jgi:hypothetical protein